MTIKDRNLKAGMTLIGKYHKQEHKCSVVQGEGDKVRYRLEDNREFKSPSAAGMAITGHACDGWVFWSVQTEETTTKPDAEKAETLPAAETEHKEEPVADAPKGDPKKTGVFLVPNQKGVPEGQIRWFCRDCGKSFITSAVEIPGICPAKHQAK
jgi:hypothetical protein